MNTDQNRKRGVWLCLGLISGVFAGGGRDTGFASEQNPIEPQARVEKAVTQLPLLFIENRQLFDPQVAFYVPGQQTSLYFTSQGVTFSLSAPQQEAVGDPEHKGGLIKTALTASKSSRRWNVALDFIGANPQVQPIAEAPQAARISYFKGRKEDWKTGLRTYRQLRYPDLWPGIDLVYSGTVNRLKYHFVVKPGADPSLIRLAYRGASDVQLTDIGQLEVVTPIRSFQDDRPVAYQEQDGRQLEVACDYLLEPKGEDAVRTYGFKLDDYDSSKTLLLDPAVFVYAGYFGGPNTDYAYDVAVDAVGNAYITGSAASVLNDFPLPVGSDLTYAAESDAFVAKLNPAGTDLLYAGYIGGERDDDGYTIAVDTEGSAYVGGYTLSTDFPVTVGPGLNYNEGQEGFVAKIDPTGTFLEYAGYIGGEGGEIVWGIAVDGAGNAYLTGWTGSRLTFPVTVGPDLTHNGSVDGFVAKVDASGVFFQYAGYIGGTGVDYTRDIAVDTDGNAYVVGDTTSDEGSFPVTVGPDLTYGGGGDAFVAKVNADGVELGFAGYIGGTDNETGNGIALDAENNLYIAGKTASDPWEGFPVIVGPDLTLDGVVDAFVTKLDATGTSLVYSGYIGGAYNDFANAIAVDAAGNAYVTGFTASVETSFPVSGGPDIIHDGGYDAFIAKVNADGTGLGYAGYIGGGGMDFGHGIDLDAWGNAYVVGYTGSVETSFPVSGGLDLTYNGGLYDGFVAKISELQPELRVFPASGPLASTTKFDLTLLVDAPWTQVAEVEVILNDQVVSGASGCFILGTLLDGGQTLRCPGVSGDFLGTGTHTVTFNVDFADLSQASSTVIWEVVENSEP